MATGGAWQSEVFDNGRDFHHADDKQSAAVVTGVPTAMYNSPKPIGGGRDIAAMPVMSISFRVAAIVFSVAGFAIIASNEGEEEGYCGGGSTYCWIMWKSINSSNMAYLLAVNVIVCFYSLVQLVLSIVNGCTGKPILSGPTTPASTITYALDQALAYMLMAGCGAGACVAANSRKGESGQLACSDGFSVSCDKEAASVAMSFIAFLAIALSAGMAYVRVYRMANI